MKKCTRCKLDKPFDEFYPRFNIKGENVYTSRCKQCNKDRIKEWRKSDGKEKWKNYDKRRVNHNMEFIKEERSKGCERCSEKRFYTIDFHHINPKNKSFTIGSTNRWTLTQLKIEIKKCIRLCRNCHAEIHYLEKTGSNS